MSHLGHFKVAEPTVPHNSNQGVWRAERAVLPAVLPTAGSTDEWFDGDLVYLDDGVIKRGKASTTICEDELYIVAGDALVGMKRPNFAGIDMSEPGLLNVFTKGSAFLDANFKYVSGNFGSYTPGDDYVLDSGGVDYVVERKPGFLTYDHVHMCYVVLGMGTPSSDAAKANCDILHFSHRRGIEEGVSANPLVRVKLHDKIVGA